MIPSCVLSGLIRNQAFGREALEHQLRTLTSFMMRPETFQSCT
jgi:hypothetical protein